MSLGGRQFVGSSVERDRCVPDILILASSARDAICSNGRSGLTPRSVARAERRYCWPSFYSPFDTRVRYQPHHRRGRSPASFKRSEERRVGKKNRRRRSAASRRTTTVSTT